MTLIEAKRKYQGKCYFCDFEGNGFAWVYIMHTYCVHRKNVSISRAQILFYNKHNGGYSLQYDRNWDLDDEYMKRNDYKRITKREFLNAIKISRIPVDLEELTKFYKEKWKNTTRKIFTNGKI